MTIVIEISIFIVKMASNARIVKLKISSEKSQTIRMEISKGSFIRDERAPALVFCLKEVKK